MKKKSTLNTGKAVRGYKAKTILRPAFYESVAEVLKAARLQAFRAVNFAMVQAYWNIGRHIVEEEQQGKDRADYGSALLLHLSTRLTNDFGKGFSEVSLRAFRQFYLCFPIRSAVRSEFATCSSSDTYDIIDSLRTELTWTHYRLLIRVDDPAARFWYMNEAAGQNWSSRALERQIHSLFYQRLLASPDRKHVWAEMFENTASLSPQPHEFIRDPYVLEFLDLPASPSFRESHLEQAIIDKLQSFLLELGKGFAFVARQKRISTDTKDFYIDLVFYNYLLKCFVLIDLKAGELTHQDIGQMDMYVRLYEDQNKGPEDNPTVGLILCTEKDHTVAKYSVLHESRQLFAAKYQLYLPTEEELRNEIESQREIVLREAEEYSSTALYRAKPRY